jgi:hypothetical protein
LRAEHVAGRQMAAAVLLLDLWCLCTLAYGGGRWLASEGGSGAPNVTALRSQSYQLLVAR